MEQRNIKPLSLSHHADNATVNEPDVVDSSKGARTQMDIQSLNQQSSQITVHQLDKTLAVLYS